MSTEPPSDQLSVRLSWPEESQTDRPATEGEDPAVGYAAAGAAPWVGETTAAYEPPQEYQIPEEYQAQPQAYAEPEPELTYAPAPPRPALPEFPQWPAAEPAPSFADIAAVPIDFDQAPEGEESVLFTVSARLEGMRTAMGTMAVRLDSMIRREEEFREFTSTRLAQYAEQLSLGVGDAAARQQQTILELNAGSQSNARAIEQLANAVNTLSKRVSDLAGDDGISSSFDKMRSATARVRDDMAALGEQMVAENELVRAEVVAATTRVDEQHEELATELTAVTEALTALSDEVRALRRRMTVKATAIAEEEPAKRPSRRRTSQ